MVWYYVSGSKVLRGTESFQSKSIICFFNMVLRVCIIILKGSVRNFPNLYGLYVLWYKSFFYQFSPYKRNSSKISSDQNWLFFAVSLNHLSFFANTPFKYTQFKVTLCLIHNGTLLISISITIVGVCFKRVQFWRFLSLYLHHD